MISINLSGASESEALQRKQLEQFLLALGPLSGALGLLYAGVAITYGNWLLGVSSGLVFLLLSVVALAYWLLRRGGLAAASATVGYGLLAFASTQAFILPFLFPALMLIAIMALTEVLPSVRGRALRLFFLITLAVIIESALLGLLNPPWLAGLAKDLQHFIGLCCTATAACLTLLLLWQFSIPLRDFLDRTLAANSALRQGHARVAAEASERQYRFLAATIPQQVWSALPNGRLDFVNQRVRDYFQWSEAQARDPQANEDPNDYLRHVIHPEDLALCRERWGLALLTGEKYEVECRLRRVDGRYRWHLIRALAVRGLDGRISKWFGTNTDIQDQKEALRALRESEERARESDRRKDEFLAMLGHELRNPLAPIVNALDLLRRRQDGALGREYAIIDRQVRYVIRLVDDLLDVARITQGKLKLAKQPIELAQAVDQGMEISRPLIERLGHLVTVAIPRRGLCVEADPVRLAQVMANLITNAAKYTDPGGRISIDAAVEAGWVVTRVRDNGRGISAAHLPHLFELFRQGDQPPERSLGGLGIGLKLVRMVVGLHGGSVMAASDGPGRGSEFTVRLPVLPTASALANSAPAAAPRDAQAARHRILVVDDNTDAAQILAEWLEQSGHQVRVADDGPVALSLAEEFAPEVVMLDIGLPSMDGFEVARRLRAAAGGSPAPRLIALTGYGHEADRERSRAAGFDAHLVKPIELQALAAALANLVGPPQQVDPAEVGAYH